MFQQVDVMTVFINVLSAYKSLFPFKFTIKFYWLERGK